MKIQLNIDQKIFSLGPTISINLSVHEIEQPPAANNDGVNIDQWFQTYRNSINRSVKALLL